jgi:hypothetical protein
VDIIHFHSDMFGAMMFSPSDVDESTHSLVLSLNDNFEGGGTYFFDSDTTIRPATGSVLSFRGDSIFHGGAAVTKGIRYILAIFLYYDEHGVSSNEISKRSARGKCPVYVETTHKNQLQKTDFAFGFSVGD